MSHDTPFNIDAKILAPVSRISSGAESVEDRITDVLGENYREYRQEWNLSFDDSKSIRSAPIHLDIEMQDFCNQSCVMCPRDSKGHQDLPYQINTKAMSDLNQIKNVINVAANEGLRSINFGAFSEPLINKNLWELISFAHDCGIVDSRVITNGLLLNRYFDQIFSSGLINLYVSLDAYSNSVYESIRGKGFEKVVRNLNEIIQQKKLRNSMLPFIRVSFVEMEQNKHEKHDFINYWINKVDHVDIQTWSDYKKPASTEELKGDKVFNCRNPWQRLAITAQGEILPCCDFNGRNLVLGNISEMTLMEAWESDKMAKVRQDILNKTSANCESCQRSRGITSAYLKSKSSVGIDKI
jgi:radical SAM protein with 4Fe4S-binding SPASM domain